MRPLDKVLSVGVILTAVLLLSLHWRISNVSSGLDETRQIVKPKPRAMTTTYVDATGTTRSVTTTRNATETIQEWAQRHADAVVDMMEQHPPPEPPE